jgi:hypothetical protein
VGGRATACTSTARRRPERPRRQLQDRLPEGGDLWVLRPGDVQDRPPARRRPRGPGPLVVVAGRRRLTD